MYFLDAAPILVRRWYALLLGLVLTAGGVAAGAVWTPTQYQATGQVIFLLATDSTSEQVNPYLNLQSGLTTTASLVATDMMTRDVARGLVGSGYTADYVVGLVPATGPLLVISANDTDADSAVATRDAVIAAVAQRLEVVQANVSAPRGQFIRALPINVADHAEPLAGSKARALIAMLAIGLIFAFTLPFLLDRWLARRPARLPGPTGGETAREARSVQRPVAKTVAKPAGKSEAKSAAKSGAR